MDEMALYVLENFDWYRRETTFSPLPLLYDYKDLCLDFDLATTEETIWDFYLPEIPQVVFFAMVLNDAVKIGVLHRWMITIIESALKELRWSIFEECLQCKSDDILEAHHSETDNNQEEGSESGDASSLPNDNGDK